MSQIAATVRLVYALPASAALSQIGQQLVSLTPCLQAPICCKSLQRLGLLTLCLQSPPCCRSLQRFRSLTPCPQAPICCKTLQRLGSLTPCLPAPCHRQTAQRKGTVARNPPRVWRCSHVRNPPPQLGTLPLHAREGKPIRELMQVFTAAPPRVLRQIIPAASAQTRSPYTKTHPPPARALKLPLETHPPAGARLPVDPI